MLGTSRYFGATVKVSHTYPSHEVIASVKKTWSRNFDSLLCLKFEFNEETQTYERPNLQM